MNVISKKQHGFTIVELLIVIVVIGILAAITIVAYNGIQNRANDTAVQSDLKSLGGKIMEFVAINDKLPLLAADFEPMNFRVSESAYGAHYIPSGSQEYNFIYCRDGSASSDNKFAIVAASKSGNVFAFRDGGVSKGVGPLTTFTTTCSNNGISTVGQWIYENSVWKPWVL